VSEDLRHNPLRATLGKALGRVPSGVFVLTALDDDRPFAMLVSWVQQAAFEPPAISVAIGKDRPIRDTIDRSKRFTVSVLGDGDKELMRHFARPRTPGDDPFGGVDVFPAPSSLPVVARALAWLDCELTQRLDFAADHDLLIARVMAGDVLRPGHSFTHVRGNGFHY
jgi:3-hydroxy-9,10-secoandrosta-1,3,5(10)-triene-9,17-dione monooxygenase reductase component